MDEKGTDALILEDDEQPAIVKLRHGSYANHIRENKTNAKEKWLDYAL